MFANIISTRTLCVFNRRLATLRPQTLYINASQKCSGLVRLDNKQFSLCCTSCLYLGTRRTHGEMCVVAVKPVIYRGIHCTQWWSSGTIMLMSGEVSTSISVDDLKGKDELLYKVIGQLNEDHGIDICVIETTEERKKYADYIVVVSGASTRHLKAMTNHLYRQSKKKSSGQIASVNGIESNDWMVVDRGSIVVHLFLPEVRAKYELEKLWSLGPEQDEQYKAMIEDDRFSAMMKNAKLEDFFIKEEKPEQ